MLAMSGLSRSTLSLHSTPESFLQRFAVFKCNSKPDGVFLAHIVLVKDVQESVPESF